MYDNGTDGKSYDDIFYKSNGSKEEFYSLKRLYAVDPIHFVKPLALVTDTNFGRSAGYLMERIKGETLLEKLKGADSVEEVYDRLSIMEVITDVLHGIHSKGVYHGDIKVDNIMVEDETERIVLIDPMPSYKYNKRYTRYKKYIDRGKRLGEPLPISQKFDMVMAGAIFAYTRRGIDNDFLSLQPFKLKGAWASASD